MLDTLHQVELQSCLLSTDNEWASPVHLLQQEKPSLILKPGSHSTPAGMSATAVSDMLANADLHKQQPAQTCSGGRPLPTPAPVCISAHCKPHRLILPADDYDVGPCIPNDTHVQADCLCLRSILYTYF